MMDRSVIQIVAILVPVGSRQTAVGMLRGAIRVAIPVDGPAVHLEFVRAGYPTEDPADRRILMSVRAGFLVEDRTCWVVIRAVVDHRSAAGTQSVQHCPVPAPAGSLAGDRMFRLLAVDLAGRPAAVLPAQSAPGAVC